MQDATAQLRPNQHPKHPRPSRAATWLLNTAQAPSVATSPTMGSPNTTNTGSSTTSASPDGGTRDPIQPYAVSAPDTAGNPTSGEPIQGRIQQGSGTPEFTSSIPVPGSTVSSEPSSRPSQLRIPTNNPIQQRGSADLYAFEQQQPGILQQLFPNFSGDNQRTAPSQRGKRGKS